MKIIFSVIIILFIFPILFMSSYSQDEIENFFKIAKDYSDAENFEEEIKTYDKILEIDPNNIRALNKKGAILMLLSNGAEGINFVDKALEVDPNYAPALVNKGIWIGINDDEEKAIEYFDRALQIEPEDLNALFNKSNALKTIDFHKSLNILNDILTIDPTNKRAISEKTILLNLFPSSRMDGHLQSILRNSDGQLIGYLETDVIFMSNYKDVKNSLLEKSVDTRIVVLDNEEFYYFILRDVVTLSVENKMTMRTGTGYLFGNIGPQYEEIEFPGITGRQHGYMVDEGDTVDSLFQFLFSTSDFTEEKPK